MSVAKSAPATVDLLATYIACTPSARLTDAFETDVRVMNRRLLEDSIKEAMGAAGSNEPIHYEAKRLDLHRIYTRKTKELAALYPVIFSVENALRSTFSVALTTQFDRADWWVVVRDAVNAGKTATQFTNICGKPATGPFTKQAFWLVGRILDGPNAQRLLKPASDDELFVLMSISELRGLMTADWNLSRQIFRSDSELGYRLDKTAFNTRLTLIRDARNELFHSNPIKNRNQVFSTAEDILDALDFHLGDYDADLKASNYIRSAAAAPRKDRHLVPARPFPRLRPTP